MPPQSKTVRIGIDLMGSDNAPEVLLRAAELLAPGLPSHVELVAIGHPSHKVKSGLSFADASETIEMDDPPLFAVRRKRDSSICVGLRMLKQGKIDAFVSAGNTGALVTAAKTTLSMIPGFLRPALLALMPTKGRPLAVLDVGANVACKAAHFVQFAAMGAAYQHARHIEKPSVGLLNIGTEALKGTSELCLAYQELTAKPHPDFSFAGNIEGKEVFNGNIDVLVTDGFTGNIFLKTAEGLASFVLDRLSSHLPPAILGQIREELKDLQRHLHYAEYPGAILCGVKGIVIKCHGYSSPEAFLNGICEAIRAADGGFLQTPQSKIHRDPNQNY